MNGKTSFWAALGELLIQTDWRAVANAISVVSGRQPPYILAPPPSLQLVQPPPINLEPTQLTVGETAETVRIIRDILNKQRLLEGDPKSSVGSSPNLGDLDYSSPVDAPLAQKVSHPAAVLVCGRRGSGKSALIMRLQELLRDVAPAYAIGLPAKATRLLPSWYGLADDPADVPPNATVYFPESYRFFHARSTQSHLGRKVSELVNLSRHRRHTLFFDVQNTSQLDRNIVSEVDLILVKEPGPFHLGFERHQLGPVVEAARAAFSGIGQHRKKKAVWVFSESIGQMLQNDLPSFWTQSLSRIFADTGPVGESLSSGSKDPSGPTRAKPRRAQTTPTEIKAKKARRLKEAGYSLSEIAKMLGISKSYVHKLLKLA